MPKHIPVRTCSACRTRRPKEELLRVVKSKEGNVALDETHKAPGRGAYLCKELECVRKARKGRRLERSFRCKISSQVYDQLESEMQKSG